MMDSGYCADVYNRHYQEEFARAGKPGNETEIAAQKFAIRETLIEAMLQYPAIEPSSLWSAIHSAHLLRKSWIANLTVVQRVTSAENSWKKSSGHATQDEAETHQKQYVVDNARWNDYPFYKHHPNFCEVCDEPSVGAWTLVTPHQGDRRYFCQQHSAREVLAGRLIIGMVISSD